MFNRIQIQDEHRIYGSIEVQYYIENIFDHKIRQILPYKFSVCPPTVYDLCKHIYYHIERFYLEYGIYVYPHISISKRSKLFMDISTISIYKLYSILSECNINDIDEAPVAYFVEYDHSNISNKCISSIVIVCSHDKKDISSLNVSDDRYAKKFTLDDISEPNKAIIYAILSTMSYDVDTMSDIGDSDFIYRNTGNGEIEFQFYTTMGSNSISKDYTEETFRLNLKSDNVYDLIMYADYLKRKYNKRIFIPNAYFGDFGSIRLDTLLVKSLLRYFICISDEIYYTLLEEEIIGAFFSIKQDNHSFGFYTTDNIESISLIDKDNNVIIHVNIDELNLTDYQKRILSVVYDLYSSIELPMTKAQFNNIINNN